MNRFADHGAVSWTELRTTDPQAALQFYNALFGWNTEDASTPEAQYTVVKVGDEPIGGVMNLPAQSKGTPPHWGSYVTVEDVDATLDKTRQLGGSVVVEANDVPGVGRMAVIQDPQGALVSVITYSDAM